MANIARWKAPTGWRTLYKGDGEVPRVARWLCEHEAVVRDIARVAGGRDPVTDIHDQMTLSDFETTLDVAVAAMQAVGILTEKQAARAAQPAKPAKPKRGARASGALTQGQREEMEQAALLGLNQREISTETGVEYGKVGSYFSLLYGGLLEYRAAHGKGSPVEQFRAWKAERAEGGA